MPKLTLLDGLKIVLYYRDHPPPHVHVRGAGIKAKVGIEDRRLLGGTLTRTNLKIVTAWVEAHEVGLLAAWEEAAQGVELTRHGW